MKLTCELTSAAVLTLISTTVCAQTLTFSRADYATSDAPRGIATADFNRDGAMDLALVNTGRKSIAVLINESTQGRGFVQRYEIVLGGGPFEVVAADLNNDSLADLVVANADLNTIDIVLGSSTGGFETPQHIAVAGFPRGVAVGELDFDGYQDIVYTEFDLDRVQILHGDRTGQFTARAAAMPTGPRPQGVVIGQFLGPCCRPDIAVSSTTTGTLSLFQQDNSSGFQRLDVATSAGLNVLTAADFNGDGRTDIAGVSTASNKLVLLRDTGSGWNSYAVLPTAASPRGIAAADLNKDGRLDLVTANRSASNVSVYLARADNPGGFAAAVTYAAGSGARDVVAADYNLDGFADLATANEYGDSASVLTNMAARPAGPFWELRSLAPVTDFSPFVAVGNFNGNGVPDVLSSSGLVLDNGTLVPLNNGSTRPRNLINGDVGDVNGDGRLDAVVVAVSHDATGSSNIAAEVYYGNGAGNFQYGGAFGPLGYVFDVKMADFNRDGRSDLAAVSVRQSAPGFQLEVLLANGSGFTVQPPVSLAGESHTLDVGDLDRNGTLDLAVSYLSGVQLLKGDGKGAFSMGEFLGAPGTRSRVFAVDVSRDGILDIVSGGDEPVVVWLGTPSGTYGPPQKYGSYSYDLVVADLTGDGNPDLLSESGLQRGAGNGGFSAPEPVNIWFHEAAPVDYDHDGRMDLVLVNYYHTMILFTRAARGPNVPPVAIVPPDLTMNFASQFGQEPCEDSGQGPSYDPNLDQLTFEWRDRNGRIFGTREVLCPGPLPSGTHTFTLVVRDGHGGESSDSTTITVTPFKESVVVVADNPTPSGAWQLANDTTADSGRRLWHPDAGAAKLNTALASPTDYVDLWFLADPAQNYKLWVRLKAQNDSWANDSIFVQFAEGALAGSQTRYRTGTTDALDINLEECSGCGVAGWGWRDERWGATRTSAPVLLRFATAGWQRLRVQTREDGVSIDQIVLSSEKYVNTPPGPAKRDGTLLPRNPF